MAQQWIDLDADERKELADLLWHAAMTLAYCVELEEDTSEYARRTRRQEAHADALAERVEDADVPLTVTDVRAALRLIRYQGGMREYTVRVERITIILKARCVNAQRKSVTATK